MRTLPDSFMNMCLFMKPYVTLVMYIQHKWLKDLGVTLM